MGVGIGGVLRWVYEILRLFHFSVFFLLHRQHPFIQGPFLGFIDSFLLFLRKLCFLRRRGFLVGMAMFLWESHMLCAISLFPLYSFKVQRYISCTSALFKKLLLVTNHSSLERSILKDQTIIQL